ncbi:ribonuclease H-like domain-containing protein [Tanacetum coccineum]
MDLETTQTNTTAKFPILKQENGNSFKPTTQTTNADGTSTLLIPGPITIEEKYKDAKTLFAAIQTRFGGNKATKKTQKTLLKQMYENFRALSTESLDSIFNMLQKIVSQLAILGENISQEDLNLKFLRSLSCEWNTYVMVCRNKHDLDIMSFDDLYNNFRIIEQEVKGTATSSLSSSSQNMAFVSSPSSTNKVNTAYEVSLANTQVSTASTQVSTANLSDATVYAFLANQPNRSQLVHEDLEQIHEDDLEEMDLKWQLALLSMRTRRFFKKTGRKITINGSDTAEYDKTKVECFNSHKMGHFTRECRAPRNQDSRNRNQDSSRRTVNVEETSSKAMLAIDGAGFGWSYMADDEVLTNMALMDFSDFELLIKRGLASVEEQLVFYKKNEVIFYDQITILKRDISYKDLEISMLKSELEKLKQEKESIQLKIENFDNAFKSLDKLIRSQITDKNRKGVGFESYNVVPSPHAGLFSPSKLDLSNSGLEEFQQPEFEGYVPKTSKSDNEVRESPVAPLVEELVSDDKLEKKTVFPTIAKIEFIKPKQQEKPVRKPVKYAKMYRSQCPRGNQRNYNNQKSQQLGNDFVMYNKACFVCGSFDHAQANCNYHKRERVVYENNYTRVNYNYYAKKAHPSAHKNMALRAVLMKTDLRPLNTAMPVNTAHLKTTVYSARPMSHFSKSAQSIVKRPYQMPKIVNTARPNSAVVNTVRENQVNAVKASGHPQKENQCYVDDIIFGSTKKELCTEFEKLMHDKFQMSSMGELTFFLGLQVKQKEDGIFMSQDKYVVDILRKFSFTYVRTASTPIDTEKPLLKDSNGDDVDVHLYRSMIGSLMYLTSSRPDIMFVVCACARFQVTPKVSHLHVVKRIFRYLKGQPKLGLWYPRDSSFDLVAYSDSDYAGASLDRKSTIGAEYVAAASCCGQVLWIQNQMLDYGISKAVWLDLVIPIVEFVRGKVDD